MVYSCIFVTQITKSTNATSGKRAISNSRNYLHTDENIKTGKTSGLANCCVLTYLNNKVSDCRDEKIRASKTLSRKSDKK